jgi:glycine/D-amino acid oxidase-like deaminating enzyme
VWSDTLPGSERVVGEPLPGDADVDVAVVGAGLTGLWTAWYLARTDPSLRIAVLERDTVGFGASGRNGGWCSSLLPMSLSAIARRHGRAASTRMQTAMHDTVAEVARFAAEHGPPGIVHAGGTIDLARSEPQRRRLLAELDEHHGFGFDEADYRWLDAREATDVCAATGVLGAIWSPHCATVHPLRLTHAVAGAVIATGARIHEHTAVRELRPGRLVTERGTVRADVVVRATEAYTSQLPGLRRAVLPIYSLMIATEPLADHVWERIGLAGRPTFADGRRMIIYGQRTADGRFAFGGRGAPYHFGSAIRPDFDTDARIRELLTTSLRELFPIVADAEVTHHWGGVLAAPRDWTCSVRFDRATGTASAGGYVGDGVSTTNLAGRTLAALITGAADDGARELTRLPWVGHRSRRWEPEPLRWLGVNAARTAAGRADRAEARTGRPSRVWSGVADAILRR